MEFQKILLTIGQSSTYHFDGIVPTTDLIVLKKKFVEVVGEDRKTSRKFWWGII